MSRPMICPRGHRFDAPDLLGTAAVFRPVCPTCGASARVIPTAVTGMPPGIGTQVPATVPAAALVHGSGRGFWIAMLVIAVLGSAAIFALPLIFPNLDWFGWKSPLSDTRSATVLPGVTALLKWDDPPVEKASMTVQSPGNPVNVFVVRQSDLAAAERTVSRGMTPESALATRTWVETVTIDVAPEKKPFALILTTTARKAEVAVTVKGR